jgi:hypothetical protein
MIHSRIARYLRTRDWHTAALELAIVMLGVYLGIEASNWNASRQAAADERYYAERLVDELDESVRLLDRGIEIGRNSVAGSRRAIDAIRAGAIDPGNPDAFVRDFQAANAMPEGTIVDGAIEELRSSGRMALIRTRPIREALSRYYAELQSSREQGELCLDGWNVLLRDIYRETDADFDMAGNRLTLLDPAALNGNVRVARALSMANAYQQAQVLNLEQLRTETLALKELIAKEIR